MKNEWTTEVSDIISFASKALGKHYNWCCDFCSDLYDTSLFYPLDNLPYQYPEFCIYGPNDEEQDAMVIENIKEYDVKENPLKMSDNDLLKIVLHKYALDTIDNLDTEFRIAR